MTFVDALSKPNGHCQQHPLDLLSVCGCQSRYTPLRLLISRAAGEVEDADLCHLSEVLKLARRMAHDGEISSAKKQLAEAREILGTAAYRKIDRDLSAATLRNNAAYLAFKAAEYSSAERHLRGALACLTRLTRDQELVAAYVQTLLNLCTVQVAHGNFNTCRSVLAELEQKCHGPVWTALRAGIVQLSEELRKYFAGEARCILSGSDGRASANLAPSSHDKALCIP